MLGMGVPGCVFGCSTSSLIVRIRKDMVKNHVFLIRTLALGCSANEKHLPVLPCQAILYSLQGFSTPMPSHLLQPSRLQYSQVKTVFFIYQVSGILLGYVSLQHKHSKVSTSHQLIPTLCHLFRKPNKLRFWLVKLWHRNL